MKRLLTSLIILLSGVTIAAQQPTDSTRQATDSTRQATTETWQDLHQQALRHRQASNGRLALRLLEQAYKLHASDTILRDIAATHYDRGNYRAAINLSQMLLSRDTLEADLMLIARSHEKLSNADSALVYEKIIMARNPENAANAISLSGNYEDRNSPDSALLVLDDFSLRDPDNLAINARRAYLLYQAGEYAEALDIYRRLKTSGDNSVTTNYYMGLAYARSDSLDQSYDCLRTAARKDRYNNQYILAQLGIVASKVGGAEQEGVTMISQALEKITPDADLMWSLLNTRANALIRLLKFEDAIDDLKRSLTYRPQRLTDIYHIAYLYSIIHDRANADKYFQMFISNAERSSTPERYQRWIESAREHLRHSREEHFFQGDDENLKDF